MKKPLLILLTGTAGGLVVSQFVSGALGELLFIGLSVLLPVVLMAVGALRHGRLGRLGAGLMVIALVLEISLFTIWYLKGVNGVEVFGLPLAAVIQFGGLFLLPLVLTSAIYAWTFDSHGLGDEDLRRLRALGAARREL